MRNLLVITFASATLVCAQEQQQQTSSQSSQTTVTQTTASDDQTRNRLSAGSSPQSWTGALFDANCASVRSDFASRPAGAAYSNKESSSSRRETTTTPGGQTQSSSSSSSSSTSTTVAAAPGAASVTTIGSSSRYQACQVTPATSAFALESGGMLYEFDAASNALIQKQLSIDPTARLSTTSPSAITVTVPAIAQGGQLVIAAVRIL